MRTAILFSLLFLLTQTVFGQQAIYVVNLETKEAIPFSTLLIEESKHVYMSDENGFILLPKSESISSTLMFEHLSFQSKSIVFEASTDTLFLKPKLYTIPEILIHEISPFQVLQKVVEQLSSNFPKDKFYLDGLYRQTHKENGLYVRFIEAQVLVLNEGMQADLNQVQEESFALLELRKSSNYEKNGDQHGDHLVDLFADNPVQYLQNSILNLRNFESYSWTLDYLPTGNCKIEFQNKPWTSAKNIKGFLLINKQDFAIQFVQFSETPNLLSLAEDKSNWKFINSWYEASFKKYGDVYALENCDKWYNHEVRNEHLPAQVNYLVEERFEWRTFKLLYALEAIPKFAKQSNLYSVVLPYSPEYWLIYPIDPSVKKDLEKTHTLAHQFSHP